MVGGRRFACGGPKLASSLATCPTRVSAGSTYSRRAKELSAVFPAPSSHSPLALLCTSLSAVRARAKLASPNVR